MNRSLRSTRGMAMLFVLAALVLSVTATALIAKSRTASRLASLADSRVSLCDELRIASEAPIRHWLQTASAGVVLQPDVGEPVVRVLNDRWDTGGQAWRLRISAWDQCGMVPIGSVLQDHPISSEIPDTDKNRVRASLLSAESQLFGLDQLAEGNLSPFPQTQWESVQTFGFLKETRPAGETPEVKAEADAIGALLSTHSPGGSGRQGRTPPIWLNVNTAPVPLLRRAFALAGMDGVDAIEQARAEGEQSPVNLRASSRGGEKIASIRFVNASPVWAFRIDAEVGGVRRSWWEVWSLTSGTWEVVQRLAIHG